MTADEVRDFLTKANVFAADIRGNYCQKIGRDAHDNAHGKDRTQQEWPYNGSNHNSNTRSSLATR